MKITYKIIYMLNKFAYSKEKEGKYMFCEKCGTQLPDTAKFCTNCGTTHSWKTIPNGNGSVSGILH